MPSSKAPTEADIIFNRANIALARSQRLIQSWLGPSSGDDAGQEKTDEQIAKEDEELFKAEPETLGVGAKITEDELDSFGLRRKTITSNDKLLEQILGKKGAKGHQASKARAQKETPAPAQVKAQPVESEDEEEGRASMIKSKSARKRKRVLATQEVAVNEDGNTGAEPSEAPTVKAEVVDAPVKKDQVKDDGDSDDNGRSGRRTKAKRGGGSYLDELLAQKASKKKKKQLG